MATRKVRDNASKKRVIGFFNRSSFYVHAHNPSTNPYRLTSLRSLGPFISPFAGYSSVRSLDTYPIKRPRGQ